MEVAMRSSPSPAQLISENVGRRPIRTLLPVLFICVAMISGPGRAGETDSLAPLRFLLGRWDGAGAGTPGQGSGVSEFATALQSRVIIRTGRADYPATSERAAYAHDDLMVIYAQRESIRADYYDNEGHVIRYRVEPQGNNEVVFVSEVVAGEPRFRLSYKLAPDGNLHGRFEIAQPGKPEAFSPYLSWTVGKAKQPAH
jgi:hypothetical protein